MERDYLTNLLPLHLFLREADKILKNNPDCRYAVTVTDLSNFKYINDLYGMAEGNRTIQEMAEKFFSGNPRCILASRPYADQFRSLIAIGDVSQDEEVAIITNMNTEFTEYIQKRYPNIYFHVYTGLYIIEDNSEGIRSACDKAHFAKKCFKGNLSVTCGIFDSNAYKDSSNVMRLTHEFQSARERDSVYVYYQPKCSASTGEFIGAEALGRIADKDGNIISPGEFIPVLERTGIIGDFDDIIMEKTFADIRRWIDNGGNVKPVSLNISRIQFLKPGLIDKILALQKKYDIPSRLIELEITETTFIESVDFIDDTARELRRHGFTIDVDDFGSGYSSLSLIATLPADTIKLDCSFARQCLDNDKGVILLSGIINILRSIGFDIICEGIETECERQRIMELGCDKIQGYYYDRPMPSASFEEKYITKQ